MDFELIEEDLFFIDNFYFEEEVITNKDIENLENLYLSFSF